MLNGQDWNVFKCSFIICCEWCHLFPRKHQLLYFDMGKLGMTNRFSKQVVSVVKTLGPVWVVFKCFFPWTITESSRLCRWKPGLHYILKHWSDMRLYHLESIQTLPQFLTEFTTQLQHKPPALFLTKFLIKWTIGLCNYGKEARKGKVSV